MKCISCNEIRDKKDFFGKKECYKCIYNKKVRQLSRYRKCKICGKQLKKDKWAYCDDECALAGKVKHRKEYWTNQIS